jgi:hypothetical protein
LLLPIAIRYSHTNKYGIRKSKIIFVKSFRCGPEKYNYYKFDFRYNFMTYVMLEMKKVFVETMTYEKAFVQI